MVNVTISITEELKAEMDKYPEVNWSKVCRDAIDTYIRIIENPSPQVEFELKDVRLQWLGVEPRLQLDLHIRNNMKSEVVLDRLFYEVIFLTSRGSEFNIGSDVYLMKKSFSGTVAIYPFMRINPSKMLQVSLDITRTFACRVQFQAFFEGFKEPYNTQKEAQIPIDFWQRFIKQVVDNEKQIAEIRNKIMSNQAEKSG